MSPMKPDGLPLSTLARRCGHHTPTRCVASASQATRECLCPVGRGVVLDADRARTPFVAFVSTKAEGKGTTMASNTSKWMTVVASGAIAVMMGGAAVASPASAFESSSPKGLLPDPISEALKTGPTAASESQRQVRQDTNSLRSTDDASDLVSENLGRVLSNVGTKVARVKGQVRQVRSEAFHRRAGAGGT